jgi:hypothetical protein
MRKRFMESDIVRESVTNEDAETADSTREEWQILTAPQNRLDRSLVICCR